MIRVVCASVYGIEFPRLGAVKAKSLFREDMICHAFYRWRHDVILSGALQYASDRTVKVSARARVRFYSPADGGRSNPIFVPRYMCPMLVDHDYFDCALLTSGLVFEPGKEYEIDLVFISPDLLKERLYVGKEVKFWEFRIIAEGTITDLFLQ